MNTSKIQQRAVLSIVGVTCVVVGAMFLATAAHAADDKLTDQGQHELPSHKGLTQFHDTMDVVYDPANHNVCYVTRQSDSHSVSTFCLPEHK